MEFIAFSISTPANCVTRREREKKKAIEKLWPEIKALFMDSRTNRFTPYKVFDYTKDPNSSHHLALPTLGFFTMTIHSSQVYFSLPILISFIKIFYFPM